MSPKGFSSREQSLPNVAQVQLGSQNTFSLKATQNKRTNNIMEVEEACGASWKHSRLLFQVLNDESTSELFSYKPAIIWVTAGP
jgi:hypothetical protein